ncbi:MAG: hypothetical protein ABFS34_04135 [Gemmatimonadota bacterium]
MKDLRGRLVRGGGGWCFFSADNPERKDWVSQQTVEKVFRAVRRATCPIARAAMRLVERAGERTYYVATAPLELSTVNVRTGDVLLAVRDYDDRPEGVSGACFPLTLEDYEALRAHYDGLDFHGRLPLDALWRGAARGGAIRIIRTRQSWGLRRSQWQTRLYVLRGVHASPVQPIEASSDQHAIFELILESGGRMPQES